MPIIEILSTRDAPAQALEQVARAGASVLGRPLSKVWTLWRRIDESSLFVADRPASWVAVLVTCRRSYPRAEAQRLVQAIRRRLAIDLETTEASIFAQIRRVDDEEVWEIP